MITIYWSTFPEDNIKLSELKYFDPLPLSQHLDVTNYFGPANVCPAVIDEAKNTFVVYAPIDYHIKFDYNNHSATSNLEYSSEFLQDYLGPHSVEKIFQFNGPSYLFFSEKDSLPMTQLPAYYDDTEFSKTCKGLSATYDIGQWFRPVKPSFKLIGDEITVKQGEPLFYIKFNTSEKINLQKFDSTEFSKGKLTKILDGMMGLKFNKAKPFVPTKLIDSYAAFKRAKYKKIILKGITENLL